MVLHSYESISTPFKIKSSIKVTGAVQRETRREYLYKTVFSKNRREREMLKTNLRTEG